MTDTPRPSPSPAAGDREALARIIDPEVWATFDNSPMGQSARNRRRSIRDSLAKADQWLSAKRGEVEPALSAAIVRLESWAVDLARTREHEDDAKAFRLILTALTTLPTGSGDKAGSRDDRQRSVAEWCAAAFGVEHQTSVPQRGLRHAEEAIEAAQAARVDPAQLHALIDYIYAKPPGDLKQELGGSGVTLLALAAAAGVSADDAEAAELARVLAKPLKWFHDRNQVKNDAGFDALSYPSAALAQTEKAK